MENTTDKDIKALKNEKIDKILLEGVSADALSKLDVSGETDAVKQLITTLTDLINKLKTK